VADFSSRLAASAIAKALGIGRASVYRVMEAAH
jgi:predicted transcriptional regulator YheO